MINVAEIHNDTIRGSDVLTNDVLSEAHYLANVHEFNLAYNVSSPIRAVAGATIAAQIVQQLNSTITDNGQSKLGIQFNAYASFLSLFGLSQLTKVNDNFTGIVDYASVMIFELFT